MIRTPFSGPVPLTPSAHGQPEALPVVSRLTQPPAAMGTDTVTFGLGTPSPEKLARKIDNCLNAPFFPRAGDMEDLLEVLREKHDIHPDDDLLKNEKGQTLLEQVTRRSDALDFGCFYGVVRQGADMDAFGTDGKTLAMRLAGNYPVTKALDFLIRSGAKLTIKGHNGQNVMHYLAETHWEKDAIQFAKMLNDHGISYDVTDEYDHTLLMLAAKTGRAELFEFLLAEGADDTLTDAWQGSLESYINRCEQPGLKERMHQSLAAHREQRALDATAGDVMARLKALSDEDLKTVLAVIERTAMEGRLKELLEENNLPVDIVDTVLKEDFQP